MESQILIVAVAGPRRPYRASRSEGAKVEAAVMLADEGAATREEGAGGVRNENGRIEFPICDMRPRADEGDVRAAGGEGEGRGPDCARW